MASLVKHSHHIQRPHKDPSLSPHFHLQAGHFTSGKVALQVSVSATPLDLCVLSKWKNMASRISGFTVLGSSLTITLVAGQRKKW